MKLKLRPYQQECVDLIDHLNRGSYLCVLATGLGKTVIFSHIKRKGKMLILSHRDELVHQPIKYFDCPCGIEQAGVFSNGEEVVSASVQSLVRRLERFDPKEFDIIITDEAHHCVASTYRKIYDYFKPRLHIGFTATPNRADKVGLREVYDKIIYKKDIRWGIENNYLSNIDCITVDIGFDLSNVERNRNDFVTSKLDKVVNTKEYNRRVAEVYQEYAVGQTLIFTTSIDHANNLAELIPGSVAVSSKTPLEERKQILIDFQQRKVRCLINCLLFTEGTDLPLVETIIIARPTTNQSLYMQMVGRGVRLHPDKKVLRLIDCVGASGRNKLCTAPSLFGLDVSYLDRNKRNRLNGLITDMDDKLQSYSKSVKVWIENIHRVDLFVKEERLDFRDLNFRLNHDSSLSISYGDGGFIITPPDERGLVMIQHLYNGQYANDEPLETQRAIDLIYNTLCRYKMDKKSLWSKKRIKHWGNQPATDKQKRFILSLLNSESIQGTVDLDGVDLDSITKQEAGTIIDHLNYLCCVEANKSRKKNMFV